MQYTILQVDSSSDSDVPAPGRAPGRIAYHHDGTRASAAAGELEIAAALAAAAGRAPAGRFGGREGKMARIRAQEAAFAAKHAVGAKAYLQRSCVQCWTRPCTYP